MIIDFRIENVIQNLGAQRGMQILRKGSGAKHPFRLIHTVYIGIGVHWTMAIGTSGITPRNALCSRFITQSV